MKRRSFLSALVSAASLPSVLRRPWFEIEAIEDEIVEGNLEDYITMITPERSPLMEFIGNRPIMQIEELLREAEREVNRVTGIDDAMLSWHTDKLLPVKDGIPIGKDGEPWLDAMNTAPETTASES